MLVIKENKFVELATDIATTIVEKVCDAHNLDVYVTGKEEEFTSHAQEMFNNYYDIVYNTITDACEEEAKESEDDKKKRIASIIGMIISQFSEPECTCDNGNLTITIKKHQGDIIFN